VTSSLTSPPIEKPFQTYPRGVEVGAGSG